MSCKKIFMNVRNQIPSKASWQFKMFNIAFKVMNTTFKWFATIICVNNTIIEGSLFHLYMCQNVVSTWDTSGGRCEHDMWQIWGKYDYFVSEQRVLYDTLDMCHPTPLHLVRNDIIFTAISILLALKVSHLKSSQISTNSKFDI